MTEKTPLNRREFLERAALLGAVTIGAGSILAACESDTSSPASTEGAAAGGEETISCNDAAATADLSAAELATRTNNNYVDQTTNPEQRCDNCSLYTQPAAGQTCGGCSVVAGPINPGGWCSIWVPAA